MRFLCWLGWHRWLPFLIGSRAQITKMEFCGRCNLHRIREAGRKDRFW